MSPLMSHLRRAAFAALLAAALVAAAMSPSVAQAAVVTLDSAAAAEAPVSARNLPTMAGSAPLWSADPIAQISVAAVTPEWARAAAATRSAGGSARSGLFTAGLAALAGLMLVGMAYGRTRAQGELAGVWHVGLPRSPPEFVTS